MALEQTLQYQHNYQQPHLNDSNVSDSANMVSYDQGNSMNTPYNFLYKDPNGCIPQSDNFNQVPVMMHPNFKDQPPQVTTNSDSKGLVYLPYQSLPQQQPNLPGTSPRFYYYVDPRTSNTFSMDCKKYYDFDYLL